MALPLFLAMMGGLGIAEHKMQKGRKAQAAKARQAGAQNIMAGAGFGGPQAGLDPARVAGLQQGLASSDPMIRQQAFAEMQDYQAGLGMDMSPKAMMELERSRVNLNRDQLELQAMQNPQAAAADPEFAMNAANQLRDERRADTMPLMTKLNNYGELESLLTSELRSGPAAFASMFKFISSLDDSVVRASETGALMGGTGAARNLVMMYNEAIGQGFIDDTMANEMLQASQQIARSQQQSLEELNRYHDRQAAQYMEAFVLPQNFRGLTGGGMTDPREFALNAGSGRGEQPDRVQGSDDPDVDFVIRD